MTTIEKHRVIHGSLAGETSGSLNSTHSIKSNETKSSAEELLSITDAAVRALEKTKNPKVSAYISSAVLEDGLRMLSPRDISIVDPERPFGPLDQSGYSDISGRLSVGSKSTTASEVLIRSTTEKEFTESKPNISIDSVASSKSSTFLSGQAQPVKISAKRLREIRSPFENKVTNEHRLEADVSKDSIKSKSSVKSTGPLHKIAPIITEGTKIAKPSLTTENMCGTSKNSSPVPSPRDGGNTMSGKETLPSTMADSGYTTQNIKVIREISDLKEVTDGMSTPRGPPSTTEELLPAQEEHLDIAEVERPPSRSTSVDSYQPEIVTVQESVVTVRGHDIRREGRGSSISSISDTGSQNGDISGKLIGDRFFKFQSSGLRQGMLSENSSTSEVGHGKGEVQISHFQLDGKKKLIREAFAKRNQGNVPIKKHVTPKVVHVERQGNEDKKKPDQPSVNDAATTAAVAAASAVAATQPFLKAQLDLEMRIGQVFEHLSAFHNKSAPTPSQPVEKSEQKVDDLEKKLNNLTQRRLEYLEEMQKQQMQWQSQVLSISRDPFPARIDSHHNQTKLHPQHRVQYKPVTKTVLSDEEMFGHKGQIDQIREKEKSVLDTPAPRKKPPTPALLDESQKSEVKGHIMDQVTPDRKQKRGAGFLAQILADGETPQKSPFPDSPQSYWSQRPGPDGVNQRAGELVRELGDLSAQIKHSVHDGVKMSYLPDQSLHVRHEGPAPLDHYLSTKAPGPTTPYPKLKAPGSQGNAPIVDQYADVQDILQKVALSRMYLETNLDTITRKRQDTDVYSLLDQVTTDSSYLERLHVQKMVDKHIQAMNSNLEKEVLEELLKVEDAKKTAANFMIPERDTAGLHDKSKAKTVGPRSKVLAQSRVDSGLRKTKLEDGSKGVKPGEKENVPLKKRSKMSKILESDTYKSRVYGKVAASQPYRATQKEPYLRFRSTSPKAKSPVARPVDVKGVVMSTAKTQAGVGYIPSESQPQRPTRSQPVAAPHPVPPPMVGMAIPLGAPRKDGGLTAPVSFPARPTTLPYDQVGYRQPQNVGILTMKDPQVEKDNIQKAVRIEKQAKLQVQTLPSVDIDSIQPKPVVSAKPKHASTSPERDQTKNDLKFVKAEEEMAEEEEYQEQRQDTDDGDDTITERSESEPIDIAGYQSPPSAYHGPRFPPQAPPMTRPGLTSDDIASGIKRRDILQNEAVDWVEQELMARMLNELYATRREVVPHTPLIAKKEKRRPEESDDTASNISSEMLGHDSLIVEALGHDGFQLFVDAGLPIDEKLVNALVKDVILEKISSMVGQKTSQDDEEKKRKLASQDTKPSTTEPLILQTDVPLPFVMPTSPVPTPLPTPKDSPAPSPPPTPPPKERTPQHSPEVIPESYHSEKICIVSTRQMSEPAESIIDSEEERQIFERLMSDLPIQHSSAMYESVHFPDYDVATPVCTSTESLPFEQSVRTPSPTLRTPTPEIIIPSPPAVPVLQPEPQQEPQPATPEESLEESSAVVEKPVMQSVAVQAEPEENSVSPPPPEPTLRERQLSTSSVESALSSSTVSDTINERISEGQWLLTLRSEGEVPGFQIDHDLRDRIKQRLLAGGRPAVKDGDPDSQADDTLLDTEELEPDQDLPDLPPSEGEFKHTRAVIRDHTSMLALLAQMNKAQPGWAPQQLINATELGLGVDKSLGEVSFGQRPPLSAVQEQTLFSQSAVVKNGGPDGQKGRILSDDRASLDEIDEVPEEEANVSHSPGSKRIIVQPRSQPTGQGPTRAVTVAAGGREPNRHFRPNISPGGRSRNVQFTRSLSPEPAEGAFALRNRSGEVGASQTSLPSELDTHTSDQINMEALLQSRDYFTGTQSDLASTGADHYSYSINRSEEFHSGLVRQSMGSTSDMSLAPGLTKTLERSEEELAENRLTYTVQSDLQASGRPQDQTEQNGTGDFGGTLGGTSRSGPLQVSVMLPSMGEESSGTQESYEDLSEYSLGAV